jgi:serine/threonine-protein kinase
VAGKQDNDQQGIVLRTQQFPNDTLHERLFSSPALPIEVQRKAVRRLGLLAILLSVAWVLIRFLDLGIQISKGSAQLLGSDLLIFVALILSACMYALTRIEHIQPQKVLDIGLAYVLIIAVLISLGEHYRPAPADYELRGAPYVTWWILVFPLLVPSTSGKTLGVSMVAALSSPVALKISVSALGQPAPPTSLYVEMLVTCLIAVGVAFVPSRIIYSLGATVGRVLEMGSYRLNRKIGEGGMGEVWAATHVTLRRPAAVKVIRREALGVSAREAAQVLARFEREAKATAALRSQHTVELYDYGTTEEGAFYYVMELLKGFDCETMVQDFGPMKPERATPILAQICHSLFEAHERGLVHRDIKPANILVCHYGADFDFVKVVDFGLVKAEVEPKKKGGELTAEHMTSGTPAYMSPEMAKGDKVGRAADIYALGCVAYYLLTGSLLFQAKSARTMMLAQIAKEPQPPSRRSPHEIPDELEALILQCLAKKPTDRPQSALELRDALLAIEFKNPWTRTKASTWWTKHGERLPLEEEVAPWDDGESLVADQLTR